MKSLVLGSLGSPSHGHRQDSRSRRLYARLLALGAAGALALALMPATTLAAPVQPVAGTPAAPVAATPAAPVHPVAAAAAPVQPATLAGDWTQFHNGPTHQGYNASETTISASNVDALGVAWTGATGGIVYSSPAVANGVV